MKKAYVRPTIESEVFVTNAYCGACSDQPPVLTGNLLVDVAQGNWYSTNNGRRNNGSSWINDTKFDFVTSHTFAEPRVPQQSNGGAGAQYYWECTCHNGEYYLEYSAYYSQPSQNGKPTFFLYKETNRKPGLQLASGVNEWPAKQLDNRWDQMVAQVQYTAETNPVINS